MPMNRMIDLAPLDRLLLLAGKAGAPALISALLGDLRTTRAGLELAWNGPDFAALRTNTHVLVALAGTVGDGDLQDLAQRLNSAAHGQDGEQAMVMEPQIMTHLADLVERLSQLQIPAGA
jgi:hypothetical protein